VNGIFWHLQEVRNFWEYADGTNFWCSVNFGHNRNNLNEAWRGTLFWFVLRFGFTLLHYRIPGVVSSVMPTICGRTVLLMMHELV
jgi:hypothetical protein